MGYNPELHNRHSIRLPDYDYSSVGAYFVTVCCHIRVPLLGNVINGKMALNKRGEIATQCWQEIPHHFPYAVLHEYVIMPDHLHGIIEITNNANNINVANVGVENFQPLKPQFKPQFQPNQSQSPNQSKTVQSQQNANITAGIAGVENFQPQPNQPQPPPNQSNPQRNAFQKIIPHSIGSIVRGFKTGVTKQLGYSIWQRNYYEHIIRNETAFAKISEYIRKNPILWRKDRLR